MRYLYFWIPEYRGLQVDHYFKYANLVSVACPTGKKKEKIVRGYTFNTVLLLRTIERAPTCFPENILSTIDRQRIRTSMVDETIYPAIFLDYPEHSYLTLFPGKQYQFRTKMRFRNKTWYALIHEIDNHQKYTDPEKDIRYVLLPDFEVVDWKDTEKLPYILTETINVVSPWGINKKRPCDQWRLREYHRNRKLRLNHDVIIGETMDHMIWYREYDRDSVYKNALRYSTPDRKSPSKYRSWKFRTKYRKSWEKNIHSHTGTVSFDAKRDTQRNDSWWKTVLDVFGNNKGPCFN